MQIVDRCYIGDRGAAIRDPGHNYKSGYEPVYFIFVVFLIRKKVHYGGQFNQRFYAKQGTSSSKDIRIV